MRSILREYRFRKYRFVFSRTQVMGIINVTPDSFSDGGKFATTSKAVKRAAAMIKQGAAIIDVGGESSRPGAEPVSVEEEGRRVLPVIRKIVKNHPDVPVSIDSYKPEVVEEALKEGAAMINDISGMRDPQMLKIAAITQAPVVIMHMKGTPATMQRRPAYKDVVNEIIRFFKERTKLCLKHGVNKIILDPGIGFGKTGKHNLAILNRFDEICSLGYPSLIGVSRKSFIGKSLGKLAGDLETGTVTANAIAISKGAKIIRVHDVARNVQAARMADFINKGDL